MTPKHEKTQALEVVGPSASQKAAAHKLTGRPDPLAVSLTKVSGENWRPWVERKWDPLEYPAGSAAAAAMNDGGAR